MSKASLPRMILIAVLARFVARVDRTGGGFLFARVLDGRVALGLGFPKTLERR